MPDALKQSLTDIVLAILRNQSANPVYWAMWMGTIAESDGNRVTVDLDNSNKFPQRLTNCRLLRPDGFTSSVDSTRCIVFWAEHNPSLRYAIMAYDGNGTVNNITLAATDSITFDTPETNAKHDLVSEHEIGQSAGTLSATPGINTTASVSGDDTAFDVTIKPADNTKPMGSPLASITFGRPFDTAPKAVLCFQTVAKQPTPSDLSYSTTVSKIDINGTLDGNNNPDNTVITVFIRGNK